MNIYLSTIKSNVSERNKSVCAARFMIFNHGLPSFNEDKVFVVQQKKYLLKNIECLISCDGADASPTGNEKNKLVGNSESSVA